MKHKNILRATLLAASLSLGFMAPAQPDLKIGVVLSLTGPASGLGSPVNTGFELWPDTGGGENITLVTLEHGSEPARAQKNVQQLISEDKVDVINGSSTTTPTLATGEAADECAVVQHADSSAELPQAKGTWTFRPPHAPAD